MATTITEALQEIKTINKRLEKKRAALMEYLARDARLKDPLEKDGGSAIFIERERQSIADLEILIVSIRTAIQTSNLATRAGIDGESHTVAEWLTWRREVSEGQKKFLGQMSDALRQIRQRVQSQGGKVVANVAAVSESGGDHKGPPEVLVNVDEKELLDQQDRIEKLLGDLDGKLSLLNATTVIEV